MKVSAACEQTQSLTQLSVSALDRSQSCCHLAKDSKNPTFPFPRLLPQRFSPETDVNPSPQLVPTPSPRLQESLGARYFGSQRMPWRAPKNSL